MKPNAHADHLRACLRHVLARDALTSTQVKLRFGSHALNVLRGLVGRGEVVLDRGRYRACPDGEAALRRALDYLTAYPDVGLAPTKEELVLLALFGLNLEL